MRILIVAQYYTPDITAAAFRIAETADLLAERGHEVAVVTAEPHRVQPSREHRSAVGTTPEGEPGRADAREREVDSSNPESGASKRPLLRRVPIESLEGSGLKPYLRHYLSFVWRARKAGKALIREGFCPDVIWVSSPPLFVGLVGAPLRRAARSLLGRRRPKFVLDIRDIWPDTAVAAGQIGEGGAAYKVGRMLERWLYARCDALSCVAEPMSDYLRTAADKPVAVVYNGVRERGARPQAQGAAPGRGGAHPAPAAPGQEILYAGNWGRLQGLDTLLSAWAKVYKEPFFTDWRVRLLGSGVMEKELIDMVRGLRLEDNVTLEPPVAKEDALAAMERAGLLFLNLRPDPVFNYTIPSKLFDYLRAGRPIVGGIPGEGAAILAETDANVTFSPSDTDALAAALRRAAEGFDALNNAAPANEELVRRRFTREAATATLEELFHSLHA